MANELTVSSGVRYNDGASTDFQRSFVDSVDLATLRHNHAIHNVGTSEEAMLLGDVSTLGYCWLRNLDGTNFVEVRTGTGAAKFVKCKAGEVQCFRFGSGVTAPYIVADTAACQVEYLIVSN